MENNISQNVYDSKHGVIYGLSGNCFFSKKYFNGVPFAFGGGRSHILRFSTGAAGRMRKYLRSCVSEYKQMLTLTYPYAFPTNGPECKNHLKRFLQELRREYVRNGGIEQTHSSFWFLEFQERGAPHFHIFTTYSPGKNWVARTWYRIVNSEDERHLRAGTREEWIRSGRGGTISYANKYANKSEQKIVPEGFEKVGRFWGVFGARHCLSADTHVRASDRSDILVDRAEKRLKLEINKLYLEGKAHVHIRNENSMVLYIDDTAAQDRVRRKIWSLEAITMRNRNTIFEIENDAEIFKLRQQQRLIDLEQLPCQSNAITSQIGEIREYLQRVTVGA